MWRVRGWWFQHGRGVAHKTAFRLGCAASQAGRFGAAHRIFAALAGQGHGASHFHLGRLHEQGRGRAADAVQAGLHYRQAALLGYDEAQYHLAGLYATGQGFMQDSLQSFYWYHQAARQGRKAVAWSALAGRCGVLIYSRLARRPRQCCSTV